MSSRSLVLKMATNSPTKSASSNSYKDVQGYIHAVSKVQIPANPKSSRYFDFTIQENHEETRVICFTPEIKDELKRREEAKLPTSLKNISPQKRRYGEGVECRMNKYSRIEQAKNLAFQWKTSNTDESDTSVTQLLQSAPNGQSVGLKAKVLFKGDTETVYSKHAKKDPAKCDLVVADTTGAITVTLWESQIAEVEPNGCYHFRELKLNCYNKKYLGSSTKTMIEKCDDIDIPDTITSEAVNLTPNQKAKKNITGTILAIEVKKIYICINCKSKIQDAPDTALVKCPNCNLKIKKCELISTTTANIMIKDEKGENMGRFFCPHAVLRNLFQAIASAPGFNMDKNIDTLSANIMEETLLNVSLLSFQVIMEDKIVKSIDLGDTE